MAFPQFHRLEMNVMKKNMIVVCLVLCAGAAFAQSTAGASSALSSEAQMLVMPSHPSTASEKAIGTGRSLLTGSGSVSAKGERPLWEVAPNNVPVPLGDSARALKKQHAEAKKAQVTWVN
jgi:3-polyprenyl-4-hydroxybenzoate decarboxylase